MAAPESVTFSVQIPAEQLLGFDVPRLWANGVQVFAAGPEVSFVFREQWLLTSAAENQPGLSPRPEAALEPTFRNVVSVVMSLDTAKQFYKVLKANAAISSDA